MYDNAPSFRICRATKVIVPRSIHIVTRRFKSYNRLHDAFFDSLQKVGEAILAIDAREPVLDKKIAEHLGWDINDVRDGMDYLEDEGWLEAFNRPTGGEHLAQLTARGRKILSDPDYAKQQQPQHTMNVQNYGVFNMNSTLENVSQTVHASTSIPDDKKAELENLVEQLRDELANVDDTAAVETVMKTTEMLIQNVHNEDLRQLSAEGLKKAAANLAAVAPAIVGIVAKILAALPT